MFATTPCRQWCVCGADEDPTEGRSAGRLRLIHLPTGRVMVVADRVKVQHVAVNSRYIAYNTVGSTSVHLIGHDGRAVRSFTSCSSFVNSVSITPDSTAVVVACNSSVDGIRIFNIDDRTETQLTQEDYGSASISPDGRMVALSGGSGGVKMFCMQKKRQIWAAKERTLTDVAPEFSPCGMMVAVNSSNGVLLFATTDGTRGLAFNSHTDKVSALSFSSCGSYLFTASQDKRVIRWDVGSGDAHCVFTHRFRISCCIVSGSMSALLISDRSDLFVRPCLVEVQEADRVKPGKLYVPAAPTHHPIPGKQEVRKEQKGCACC